MGNWMDESMPAPQWSPEDILADLAEDDDDDDGSPTKSKVSPGHQPWDGRAHSSFGDAAMGGVDAGLRLDSAADFTKWLSERDFAEQWARLHQGGCKSLRDLPNVPLDEDALINYGLKTMPSRIRFRFEVRQWNETQEQAVVEQPPFVASFGVDSAAAVSSAFSVDAIGTGFGGVPTSEGDSSADWFWQQPAESFGTEAGSSRFGFE